MTARGFTLVELVVVIVLLGILTAYVAPRFAGRNGYDELTIQQDVKQTLRYAQQLAMSRTNNTITVTTQSSPISISITGTDNATSNPVTIPRPDGSPYPLLWSGANVTLTAATVTFNYRGATTATGTTQININGTQTLKVCINGTTGYAYDC